MTFVRVYVADPDGDEVPIMADPLATPFTAPPVRVTLTVDVDQLCPPGWPSPPDQSRVPAEWYPRRIASGTPITEFACVAAALIAAGAALPMEES